MQIATKIFQKMKRIEELIYHIHPSEDEEKKIQ